MAGAPILYCGDTALDNAACYLAGLMAQFGWAFDYRSSTTPLDAATVAVPRRLFIFSDYPASQAGVAFQQQIAEQVRAGAGILMIGGWESFHGQGGNWDGTPLGDLFGLRISTHDDRVNSSSPSLLLPADESSQHPILAGLPWNESPPTVGGWNHVELATATALLTICQFDRCRIVDSGKLEGTLVQRSPGLTVTDCHAGRAAAFLSDVAPHWVGGFVDWGSRRVTAHAADAPSVEVGSFYAQFWRQLLAWTGRLDEPASSAASEPGNRSSSDRPS